MPRGAHLKGKKQGGRPKGSLNKTTVAIKTAVLAVYNTIGGDDAFAGWARENPTEFYKIASRLIPHEVSASVDGDIVIRWKSS